MFTRYNIEDLVGIQIKSATQMLLTTVYVCAKFHKDRRNSKKVMAVSCPCITMFVDLKNFGLCEHGSTGAGEGSIGASSLGQEAPWLG